MSAETTLDQRTEAPVSTSSLSIEVEGMSCASCVRRVEKAIAGVPSVTSANVNLATERADVTFDGAPEAAGVVAAIEKAGYKPVVETDDFEIGGMTCASCVKRVEKALAAVPGVLDASVNLATERATVRHVVGSVEASAIESAVRKAGYEARRIDDGGPSDRQAETRTAEIARLGRSLVVSAVLAVPVFLLAMGEHLVPGFHRFIAETIGERTSDIIQFVLTTGVLFGPGLRFYRSGVPALLHGAPDMNSLVVLGASAAWAYSVVATFLPGSLPAGTAHVYFEAAAVIVTLILAGRFMEARAKGRTGEAIRKLAKLQPKTARILKDGVEKEVPLEAVAVGDIACVRPGERVPVDGVLTEGSSFIDESMVTGEAIPVEKKLGSEVTGGTINKSGAFSFRASRVGVDTVLAQIIRMVQQAQGAKLPIQAMVDRVTGWFVPAVMAAALLTFGAWLALGPSPALTFALVNAVAVLIIACPCAMGLATPTSIMVGTGRAAELGVLFRRGDALQSLRGVTTVVLDKTGTLTKGKPELTDFDVADGFERADVLAAAAAVEARSEHPLGRAVVEAARKEGIRLSAAQGFEAIAGRGARAEVDGRQVAVGSDRFVRELGLDPDVFETEAARLGEAAKSPLYVVIDGRLAAIVAVADPIKSSSASAVAALRDLGLKVAMVTGDNRRTAEAVAASIGIDQVSAEVLPDGKVEAIRRLRDDSGGIAFVGDGINDAPALAAADVGIAVGTGTDVAIESADIVLMSGDLAGVVNAVAISRATIRNIKQNLFWAFAYNVVLIPIAAGVLYPVYGILLSPMLAAAAMAFSSVFVLANALRMKRLRPAMSERTSALPSAHGTASISTGQGATG